MRCALQIIYINVWLKNMRHSEEYIENRLNWRARKNGFPKTNSLFFKDLSLTERSRFKIAMESSVIGNPVLLFLGENGSWTIFGTIKIISGIGFSFDSIEYSKIDRHTIGCDPLGAFAKPEVDKKFLKIEQQQILIREKGGRMLTLNGPKGKEFYSMYNILLMLLRMINN